MKIRLNKVILDTYETSKPTRFNYYISWKAIVRIEMYDVESNQIIPEYFYWVIVSNNFKEENKGLEIFMRQEQLDMLEIVNLVNVRLSSFEPDSWDNFFKYMSENFIYED